MTPSPDLYWEQRARLFAGDGKGLRAVCSYGMPSFYNRSIDLTQRLSLHPWLRVRPGQSVLDVGCGIGRWSRLLARRGARVTGIDLSPTMVEEADRRAEHDGLADRCRFEVADLAELDCGERFSLILGVTVLQHILDRDRLESAVLRVAQHLEDGGRAVFLEAAPTLANRTCDTPTFKARTSDWYSALFERCGLRVEATRGVDPAPFKIWLLPYYRRPHPLIANILLAVAVAAGFPIDAFLGRSLVSRSWHKVFVLSPRQLSAQ